MRSEVFNIQASGISSRLTVKDRTKKEARLDEEDPAIDIVYHINLSLTSQNYYLYTKIVLLSPMFVLINDTDFTLGYIQKNCSDFQNFTIKKGTRQYVEWAHADPSLQELQLRPIYDDSSVSDYDWSSTFKLDSIGALSIRCKMTRAYQEFLYLRVERKKRHDTFFVTIQKENDQFPEYLIQNSSEIVNVKYR